MDAANLHRRLHKIIGQVLTAIGKLGIKGLRFAPSAVVNIKNPSIVDFVRDGTIDRIEASGIRGQLGDAVLGAGNTGTPALREDYEGRPIGVSSLSRSKTVYDNCPHMLDSRHSGSANLSFVDGHVTSARNAIYVYQITDKIDRYFLPTFKD